MFETSLRAAVLLLGSNHRLQRLFITNVHNLKARMIKVKVIILDGCDITTTHNKLVTKWTRLLLLLLLHIVASHLLIELHPQSLGKPEHLK